MFGKRCKYLSGSSYSILGIENRGVDPLWRTCIVAARFLVSAGLKVVVHVWRYEYIVNLEPYPKVL
jgi:hypothetical protein